ncbi:MAG: membrane protein insertase YidC [Synechococcales cyanobacterium RM1_1_8]|nr:membrane protein insertase YidC [Synechococcales cyanobacterium RM1_1_8]
MDFGIGFLSNNVMLPILDFFYGLVPSYGLAIVALTLVVRTAVFPLSAGSIRSARRMKVVNPLMQERQKEVKERYKDDPTKQQEELGKIFKEFGNPLAGCLPVLFQMPILFALFATLRGSPFSDINYTANVQVLPQDKIEQLQPVAFATKPQNIYFSDDHHTKIAAVIPSGNRLAVGDKVAIEFKTLEGESLTELVANYKDADLTPQWSITKGDEVISISPDGTITALQPGDATLQGTVPGLAANRGFLFIKALGRVGATNPDGSINWDIIAMVAAFGVSLFASQQLTSQGNKTEGEPTAQQAQQETITKVTPVLFSGMFLFFPLPAGVLMYMVIANIFQTVQTFFLMREPLPDNIQKLLDDQTRKEDAAVNRMAFEPKGGKAKMKTVDVEATPVKSTPANPKAIVKKRTKKRNK